MDVGKKRELGAEALLCKSLVITNNLNAIDSDP